MKHIGKVKPDTLINILNWVGIPLVGVYILSMIIVPWIEGEYEWRYVQNVWHNWQSLNVGILAFISSIIAFNISRFNANKQRERNFIAAKAFLPEALSELTTYFKFCGTLLTEAWDRVNGNTDGCRTPLQQQVPELTESYKETFSQCIALAEPDVSEYLAYMLMRLQIHISRLNDVENSFREDRNTIFMLLPANIITYMYCLAELQALINKIFDYARGLEDFDGSKLVWDDFRNAYGNLDISFDDFDDLVGFTQRTIARNSSDENT